MNMTTGRRGIVWKTPDITADGLKMFACIVMLIQTVGIAVIEKGLIHLDQYTQESLNQAMSQDSRLMTLAGIGSMRFRMIWRFVEKYGIFPARMQ